MKKPYAITIKICISIFILFILFAPLFSMFSMQLPTETSDNKYAFRIIFWGEYLGYENLTLENFTGCDFTKATLNGAICRRTCFRKAILKQVRAKKTKFINARFYKANLESGDFTEANFSNAVLLKANLKGATFTKAIFKNARGLTNEQKQYLRDHGALNVPEDLTPEQFLEEKMKIKAEMHNWLVDTTDAVFDFLTFGCCKKHKKHKN